jgi:hypothetical protein
MSDVLQTLRKSADRAAPAADTEEVMRCRDMMLALLASRAPGFTICPSEVARAAAPGGGWRAAMPAVHAAVDRLIDDGVVRLTWKGRPLAIRSGPYRIGYADRDIPA